MGKQAFLCKYAEIGIKGKNRYKFENALCEQIRHRLSKIDGEFTVVREQGRIYVEADGDYDFEDAIEEMSHVFGVSGISPVDVIEDKNWDNLTVAVGDFVERQYGSKSFSFKVKCRRSDKGYPLTSPEVCVEMGGYLLERFPGLSVDVHEPDVYIWVEVRDKAFVYSKVYPGACGMPLGTNGKAMLLLSGGIDSPVAGYMIAKRGVYIDAVYFHAPPYTSERAQQKVVDLAKLISRYVGPIRLHVVNFTEIQMYIYEQCPHEELTIIMRRYMMRIAEKLALQNDCLGLITGESIGQVASQTMHSLAATNEVCTLPVYRPLIGFDKQEIVDISEKIGTFETSIQPFEDCCTIFVAKHPVTRPELKVIRRSEENLIEKIEDMVNTAMETIQIIEIDE
ncbi:MAG: tRNA 4-thiouridine(8) synthase ThiI [Lachnospiraceae bacterium]|nr:tRNA 4-thiouridine(8) synthase ThiI [Lachnospiraceae bacterium]